MAWGQDSCLKPFSSIFISCIYPQYNLVISFCKPSKALHETCIDNLLSSCETHFSFLNEITWFQNAYLVVFRLWQNIVRGWSQVFICEWLLFHSFCRPETPVSCDGHAIWRIFYNWVFMCIYPNLSMKKGDLIGGLANYECEGCGLIKNRERE